MTDGTTRFMRRLGPNGPEVHALGLGAARFSPDDGGHCDDSESVATIQAALDAGITLINTADFYGTGHNEMLLGRALKGRREKAFISVKFGVMRDPQGHFTGMDMRPGAVRNFLAYSLARLGTDYVDLFQPARIDPQVPIEETVGAMGDMVKAGYVRYVGLSEVGPGSLRRAHAVHPIVAVEAEYSLMGRDVENNVLPAVRDLGVGFVAHSVLSGGLLAGGVRVQGAPSIWPRRAPGALEHNLQLVERFRARAEARNATPTQLALAWALAKGDDIVALIGVRNRTQLNDAMGALKLELTAQDVREIEDTMPPGTVMGGLFPQPFQAMIDRERSQ